MAKKGKEIKEIRTAQIILKREENKYLEEKRLREKLESPMIRLSYQYAIDVVLAKLRLINADLTEQNERQVIRSLSSRIKEVDSICKKLVKKNCDATFEAAVSTLNDIAGVRAVCYFCDDIDRKSVV